ADGVRHHGVRLFQCAFFERTLLHSSSEEASVKIEHGSADVLIEVIGERQQHLDLIEVLEGIERRLGDNVPEGVQITLLKRDHRIGVAKAKRIKEALPVHQGVGALQVTK